MTTAQLKQQTIEQFNQFSTHVLTTQDWFLLAKSLDFNFTGCSDTFECEYKHYSYFLTTDMNDQNDIFHVILDNKQITQPIKYILRFNSRRRIWCEIDLDEYNNILSCLRSIFSIRLKKS